MNPITVSDLKQLKFLMGLRFRYLLYSIGLDQTIYYKLVKKANKEPDLEVSPALALVYRIINKNQSYLLADMGPPPVVKMYEFYVKHFSTQETSHTENLNRFGLLLGGHGSSGSRWVVSKKSVNGVSEVLIRMWEKQLTKSYDDALKYMEVLVEVFNEEVEARGISDINRFHTWNVNINK